MSAGYSVHRFNDAARLEELHRLVQDAFRDLPIDPPSSALKESSRTSRRGSHPTRSSSRQRRRADRQDLLHARGRRALCRPPRGAAGLAAARRCQRAGRGREGRGEAARRQAHDARRTHRAARQCRAVPPPRFRGRARNLPPGFTTPTSYDMELVRRPPERCFGRWRGPRRYTELASAIADIGGVIGLRNAAEIRKDAMTISPPPVSIVSRARPSRCRRSPDRAARKPIQARQIRLIIGYPPGRLGRHHGAAGIAVARRAARPVRHCREPARWSAPTSRPKRSSMRRRTATRCSLSRRRTRSTPLLYEKLNHNFLRDIEPVAGLIRFANVVVVNPSVPVKTISEVDRLPEGQPRQAQHGVVRKRIDHPYVG